METMSKILIGVVLIVIGIGNAKGNINSLHSYHRKRVSEEHRLPFGKLVGSGTIVIGFCITVSGILAFAGASELFQEAVAIIGLALGIPMIFYAMFKYNKGVF